MFKKIFKFKFIAISFVILNLFAQFGLCYQTALITYPENNKNWKQVYFGKQDKEVISQWIPSYSQNNDWAESVVFHAYNWAKGNSCYRMMMNLQYCMQLFRFKDKCGKMLTHGKFGL